MSSRDGSEQTGRPRRSAQPRQNGTSQRQPLGAQPSWDIDPAEIDRYLSGRPSRDQDSQRTQQSGGTADQLDRLQRAVGRRQEPRTNEPRRTSRSPSAAGREHFAEPEDDDTHEEYDDSVVYTEEDDGGGYAAEEVRAVPKRQPARRPASRPRQARAPRPEPQRSYEDYDDQETENRTPPPRRTRVTGQRPAPPRQYNDATYADQSDLTYDDQLYNDDPYLDYDDEGNWNEPTPPRRASRPRPQVKFSKPNITIPEAISNAAILKDTPALTLAGLNILSLMFMIVIVNNRFEVLPPTIFTHVSASGVPEDVQARDAIWRIPLMSGMLILMNLVAAWFFAAIDRFAGRFILAAGLLVQFIAWIALIRYLW